MPSSQSKEPRPGTFPGGQENRLNRDDLSPMQATSGAADAPAPTGWQALLQIAVARQNDVLMITAVEGTTDRIVYVNPVIARRTGYSPKEVIGKTPRMFQGPDTSRETLALIRGAVDAQQPIRTELLNYRKDRSIYWTEINITPIFDSSGKATHMVSVQRDITSRKLMQGAMQRKDERFLLALEASANAIWEWNVVTDMLEYRDDLPGSSWHGLRHGNMRGKGLATLLDLVHPDDRDRLQQTLISKLHGHEHLHVNEYRLRRPSGSYANVSDRQFILRNPDGTVERLIGSILDISEKTELAERRLRSQRLELLGEMTGGIAHNFNNLLTVILGNVDQLRDEHVENKAALNTIRMIDEAAQRGAALTEHLMSSAQSKQLSLKTVDLRRMIDSIEPVWRNLLPQEIRFEVRHDPGLWSVSTDKGHLEAAILNLVLNARDAMPEGGDLVIETKNIEAASGLLRARDGIEAMPRVIIEVSDNGIGMPPEDVKAAFNPFFTTKPPGKGTGLGLSSAYGFMQQSGGFLRLQSTPGKGTTVSIFLTVADDQPAPEAEPKTRPPLMDGGHRVLVVDDDPLVREYVQALLKSLKYNVTSASNGADALRLLSSGCNVDLLFTDILMEGGMNGWELASRARELCPDVPVLFTSAYPESVQPPVHDLAGVIRILRKPYRARDLSIAILAAIAMEDGPENQT